MRSCSRGRFAELAGVRQEIAWVSVFAACLISSVASWAREPSLEIEEGRWLVLTSLPALLDHEAVSPQLTKGLTSTFVLRVDLLRTENGKNAGAARVELRYDLWDEEFRLTVLGIDGQLHRQVVSSRSELLEWWSQLRLRVVDLTGRNLTGRNLTDKVAARVTLDVVPFSRSEQVDTQRWFAESVSRSGLTVEGIPGSGNRAGDLSRAFGLLIATSIQRRPLTTFRWIVDLPRDRSP